MTDTNPIVLKSEAAAHYLGLSTRFLEKLRLTGGGPRFVKVGRRVLYRREDLDRFLEERTVSSTSELGGTG